MNKFFAACIWGLFVATVDASIIVTNTSTLTFEVGPNVTSTGGATSVPFQISDGIITSGFTSLSIADPTGTTVIDSSNLGASPHYSGSLGAGEVVVVTLEHDIFLSAGTADTFGLFAFSAGFGDNFTGTNVQVSGTADIVYNPTSPNDSIVAIGEVEVPTGIIPSQFISAHTFAFNDPFDQPSLAFGPVSGDLSQTFSASLNGVVDAVAVVPEPSQCLQFAALGFVLLVRMRRARYWVS